MWLDVSGMHTPGQRLAQQLRTSPLESVQRLQESLKAHTHLGYTDEYSPLAGRLVARQRHLETASVWHALVAPNRTARHWTCQLLAQQTWNWLEEAFPGCNKSQEARTSALQQALREFSPGTHEHSKRVGELALRFANDLGVDELEQEKLKQGAELMEIGLLGLQIGVWSPQERREAAQEMKRSGKFHDIGKLSIPEEILHKSGPLTEEERAIVEMHPLVGEAILSEIPGFEAVLPAIRHHHERWDGKGYTDRLKGSKIPLQAQIIALSDTFDALTEDRPYRAARSVQQACQEILRQRGGQFDPELAEAFVYLVLSSASLPKCA